MAIASFGQAGLPVPSGIQRIPSFGSTHGTILSTYLEPSDASLWCATVYNGFDGANKHNGAKRGKCTQTMNWS